MHWVELVGIDMADSKLRARLADVGGTVIPGSPAAFGRLITEEIGKWGKVVKFSGPSQSDPENLTMAPPNIPQRPVPQILPALARMRRAGGDARYRSNENGSAKA